MGRVVRLSFTPMNGRTACAFGGLSRTEASAPESRTGTIELDYVSSALIRRAFLARTGDLFVAMHAIC